MPHLADEKDETSNTTDWNFLEAAAAELGFSAAGACPAHRVPEEAEATYAEWLERGQPEELAYLSRHLPQRFDPRHEHILEGATAIIVVAAGYADGATTRGLWRHVAAHARGRDYHLTVKERLRHLAGLIETRFPGCRNRIFVDTAPFMERTWAVAAGIGNIGRNGCLIVPGHGCRVVLGAIVSAGPPAPVPPDMELRCPSCATCRSCVEACPTGALREDGLVDASRCLSCWTIENRGEHLPDDIGSSMELVFGCDRCTSVCPLNAPEGRTNLEPPPHPGPEHLGLEEIADPTDLDLDTLIAGTALERTGSAAISRNARALVRARNGKG